MIVLPPPPDLASAYRHVVAEYRKVGFKVPLSHVGCSPDVPPGYSAVTIPTEPPRVVFSMDECKAPNMHIIAHEVGHVLHGAEIRRAPRAPHTNAVIEGWAESAAIAMMARIMDSNTGPDRTWAGEPVYKPQTKWTQRLVKRICAKTPRRLNIAGPSCNIRAHVRLSRLPVEVVATEGTLLIGPPPALALLTVNVS